MSQPTQPGVPKIITGITDKETQLILADFDGTIADTLSKIEGGLSVEQAYELAIKNIFGQRGVNLYEDLGGLQNKGPFELMSDMIKAGDMDYLKQSGEVYFANKGQLLNGLVPVGQGASLENPESLELFLAELLVREKLLHLSKQIGEKLVKCPLDQDVKAWPQPCTGFVQFYQMLMDTKIGFGVVSSGHELFIRECFNLWQIPQPKMFVTDDLMRSPIVSDIPSNKLTKPELGPIIAHKRVYGPFDENATFMIGDSVKSDGGMAKNAGIPFVWITTSKDEHPDAKLKIDDWRKLISE